MKNIIVFLLILLIGGSSYYVYKNHRLNKEAEKKKERLEKEKKKIEKFIEISNNVFLYEVEKISYIENIDVDTVKVVYQAYLEDFEEAKFENGKLVKILKINDEDFLHKGNRFEKKADKLLFVNKLHLKYHYPKRILYRIIHFLDNRENNMRLDKLYEAKEYLEYEIDELKDENSDLKEQLGVD